MKQATVMPKDLRVRKRLMVEQIESEIEKERRERDRR